MPTTYCYFIRGQGGALTSPGVDALAARAILIPNVRAMVFNHDEWSKIEVDIGIRATVRPLKRVLFGYSLGGNCATWVAARLPDIDFALLIALDPTWLSRIDPLGANVKKAIVFRNRNLINFFGLGTLMPGRGFKSSSLETVNIWDFHLYAGVNQSYQDRVLAEIKKVAA